MTTTTKAKKIFVEVDEDIIFTMEKIVADSANRVILVVPNYASLISSAVSLKLLASQLLKSDKLVVIVTDDQTGLKLSQKNGLIAKTKISEVDSETWQNAKKLKDEQQQKKLALKNELLSQRQEAQTGDELDDKPVKAKLVDQVVESQKKTDEFESAIYKKPRLAAKQIDINGIALIAGGDVTDFIAPESVEQPVATEVSETELFAEQEQNESAVDQMPRTNLLGKDLNIINQAKERVNGPKKLKINFLKQVLVKVRRVLSKAGRNGSFNANVLKISGAGLVLFFLFSYIFLPAVSISLIFSEDEVLVNELVKASTKAKKVNLTTLTIPAISIAKTSETTAEGVATGTGETGNLASGVVDIHNKTSSDVTLAKDTILTNISGQLKYKLKNNVTIPRMNGGSAGRVTDVAIVAASFGEAYNIINKQATFSVANYTSSQVVAYSFFDITGGTSEDTVTLTQDDIDALKADKVEELKTELLSKLQDLISDQDILLENSQTFSELSFTSSAKANQAIDKFTISLKMEVKALKVVKTDLVAISTEIVKQKQNNGVAEVTVTEPKIRDVKIKKEEATFELISQAQVLADVDENTIKDALKGKKVSEARQYLSDLESVADFRLRYKPIYIPFFLQKVPSDINKITIEKTTAH